MHTKSPSSVSTLHSPVPQSLEPESKTLRILLADEMSVNQWLAVQIIKNLGHHVTAFSTAREATRVMRHSLFDLVILGCHGDDAEAYEAALSIRKSEPKGQHIPIIAMTANTLQCDRKKREAASFDDYIAVPIDPQSMVAVINRWNQKSTRTSHFKLTAIDRNMIRTIQSVAGNGSTELLNELIELFLGSSPQRIQEMVLALQEEDPVKLYRTAHSLKGSSGQMGAVRMQQICGSLEALGKAGTLNGVAALIEELKAELERVRQDLQHIQLEKPEDLIEELDVVALTLGPELLSMVPAFKGKRILALDLYPGTLSQLKSMLTDLECELKTVEPSLVSQKGWAAKASVLLVGAKIGNTTVLEQCMKWRKEGEVIPIIVATGALSPKMLTCIEALEADFVLDPFRVDDLLRRVHYKLTLPSPVTIKKEQNPTGEVLVAESDPFVGRVLSNALTEAGFKVTHTEDAQCTLAAFQQNDYQLAIVDIATPKYDGLELLAQIRPLKDYSKLPVLVLTSRVHEKDVVHAFQLGMDDYVTKPFNPIEVVSRVHRLLKQ